MAVRWLNPSAFVRDPLFMFGSQDSYTIFTPLYAGLISLLGVEKAALWGTLAEGALFVSACWMLCRALPLKTGRYLVFLLLVSTQLVYCVNQYNYFGSLRISEPFMTARNLSVAVALMGLSFAFQGKKAHSWLLALLATAFHPLMGGWFLLLLLVWSLNLRTRTVWLLGIAVVSVLAGLAISDTGIFTTMSPEWAHYVRLNSGIVFPHLQEQQRLSLYVAGYAMLYFAGRFGAPTLRDWYRRILAISFSANLLFWFSGTYAPSALIMQLQLWRVNWLALIFAVIAIVDLARRAWLGGRTRRLISLSIGTVFLLWPWGSVPLLLMCGSFPARSLRFARLLLRRYHERFWQGMKIVEVILLVLWVGYILAAAGIVGREFSGASPGGEAVSGAIPSLRHVSTKDLLMGIGFTGGSGLVALTAWLLLSTRLRAVAIVGTLVLTLVVTPWAWDVQAARDREGDYQEYREFEKIIKPGDTVYWRQRPLAVYQSLRTANYVSTVSAIGLVFSEERTKEVTRRLQRVALAGEDERLIASSLSERDKAIAAHRRRGDEEFKPDELMTYEVEDLSRPGLAYLCGDPELDYVIHDQSFPELVVATERDSIGEGESWYLYDCRDLRTQ